MIDIICDQNLVNLNNYYNLALRYCKTVARNHKKTYTYSIIN